MTCRILHVDDHALTRSGCRLLVASLPDCELVAEFGTGLEVLPYVRTHRIDLVILDLMLPDMSGLSIIAELAGGAGLPVIVLTGQEDPNEYDLAIRLGAAGVVLKSDPTADILACIDAVRTGGTFLSEQVVSALGTLESPPVSLSPRQTAILHLVSLGEMNKEIAYRLGISMPTVSFHLAQIREKLGSDTNKRALAQARQIGLI